MSHYLIYCNDKIPKYRLHGQFTFIQVFLIIDCSFTTRTTHDLTLDLQIQVEAERRH